ncbi:MAG: RNA polymerase sporulation sigma factor SigG [Clostridia bacterium]|nr:RNA polymerase sporulation sigma factor SigG [Clostridia bacterium]
MNRKVEICGVNTSKLPVLSNEEKNELLVKIKEGNIDARQEFINGNLRLVLSVIQRFSNRGENPDDLFQVGCIGLIKAIDNFDLSQNVQFSTYAVPMIIGELRRYLRDNNSIRVSRSIKDLAYKVLAVKDKYNKEQEKELSIDEVAKILNVEVDDVIMCLDAIQTPMSLQEPVYGEGTESIYLMDQVRDKKNNEDYWTENITMAEALKRLNAKEKNIMHKRFFEGRTQMEVADEIGISQAQVSRIEKNAIEHIKRIYK